MQKLKNYIIKSYLKFVVLNKKMCETPILK